MIAILNSVLIFLAVIYAVLVFFMRLGWSANHLFSSRKHVHTSVSVLIAARNEEAVIARTIDCLLAQDFPKDLMQVIIVDDHSTDNTARIVQHYAGKGVELIQLQVGDKLNSYKKYAISKAIEQATGEIIVTTDADCRMGSSWLKTIVQYFEENNSYLLSSPVVYSEEKSWFEKLQTLEFLYLIGLGAAGIGNKMPTTCNGANLAYRKDVFYKMGGFKGIDELASGDDELFLHKVSAYDASRIGFCRSREAIVYTDAKPDLKSFVSQRKRWASKSTKYKDKKVVFLGLSIWLFNLALIVSLGVFICCWPELQWVLLTAFGIKFVSELVFMSAIVRFAERSSLLFFLPLLTVVHSFYIVYIGVAGNVGKYDWKGRQVS